MMTFTDKAKEILDDHHLNVTDSLVERALIALTAAHEEAVVDELTKILLHLADWFDQDIDDVENPSTFVADRIAEHKKGQKND